MTRLLKIIIFSLLSRIHHVAECKQMDPTLHPNWQLLNDKFCGTRGSDRIVGGKTPELGDFPWIARVGYTNIKTNEEKLFKCGGVLVNKYYVVTAAHCVLNLPSHLKVGAIRLGEHNTLTDPDCNVDVCAEPVQDFEASEVIAHKNYGNPAFKNDIALIRLNREVKFTNYVKPICMIYGDQLTKSYIKEYTEVAGWGISHIDNPQPSTILQAVKLPVRDLQTCIDSFKVFAKIGPTQICVGGKEGEDSCGGDSGGPLMKVEAEHGLGPRYYLLGVVSFGAKKCGSSTMPGIYTRVADFMDWILDRMRP